jgi:hypothetical protein
MTPAIEAIKTKQSQHRVIALKDLRVAVRHTLREPDFLNKKAALTQRADKTFAPLGAEHASRALILRS